MVPILIRACQAAYLQPQDQAHVAHGNFGDEALESRPVMGRFPTLPLVLIDNQHAILRPAEGNGKVGEGVLPLSRFAVFQHLVRAGLSHIDDHHLCQMQSQNFGGTQRKVCRG